MVTNFLRGPIVSGEDRRHSTRFEVVLGTEDDGSKIRLPSSQLNLLIAGGSGAGKSYLAVLIAEQLVDLRYSLLIVGPEGDFVGLAELPGVVLVSAERALLTPADVISLLSVSNSSVVVDFSGVDAVARSRYLVELLPEVKALRDATGTPQWVIVDEASDALEGELARDSLFTPGRTGHCLITWQPDRLCSEAHASIDAVLLTSGTAPSESVMALAAMLAEVPPEEIARLLVGPRGRVLLAVRGKPPVAFAVGTPRTTHFRHEHKYALVGVGDERRFYFRKSEDEASGASVGNLEELEAELKAISSTVLSHHCPRHDFSRWIADVFRDEMLADAFVLAEDEVVQHSSSVEIETARERLLAVLRGRRPKNRRSALITRIDTSSSERRPQQSSPSENF